MVDFSRGHPSSGLKGLFTTIGLEAMLKGKDYRTLQMFSSFVAGFIDSRTGLVERKRMRRWHTMYSDLVVLERDKRALE